MKLDILLTDGHNKHTYAILRALIEEGLKVGIIFHKKTSLSYFSKYVSKRFIVKANILENESTYKNELIRILRNNQISVLMPIGNISNNLASKFKTLFSEYTKVAIVDFNIMKIAQYKNETFRFAEKNGIAIPKTFKIKSLSGIDMIINSINFPCVIKKVNPHETGVIYCKNSKNLKDQLNTLFKFESYSNIEEYPIIQEYIEGKGAGYYALFDHGKCLAYFMHERLHELPITGGSSTFAKSTFSKELKAQGESLLTKLNWHGIAMVEFKKSKDGKFTLMEINPKFWGSFELSHKAGLNFPYLVYCLLMNKPLPESNYKRNIYFRWPFPHDFLWWNFVSSKERKKFKELKRKVKIYNDIHFDDPLTIVYNLLFTGFKLLKERKYPHGKIN